ncbi:MAG: hypothetical protein H0W08_13310 [Acidobacteria bacterium]|nr:hypothetical protein [Acidobacteriota bacterium]
MHPLPGFSFIRVPSRFMLLGVLAIAVLAATGFERLTDGLKPRRRHAAAVLAGVIIVAECLTTPLPAHRAYAVTIPAADRWLRSSPRPFVVAKLPADRFNERQHSTYMLHSMAYWQKTVHGHSGIRTAAHVNLYAALQHFPSEAALQALTSIGVTRVVLHADMYGRRNGISWLKPVYEDATARVYELEAPR